LKGFTLIELAIVLVIIGVLAGAFLSTLGSRIDTTRRAEAAKEMDIIKQALYGYAMTQTVPHLPCPDCRNVLCPSGTNWPNDGVEDRNGAACDVVGFPGNIPWVTLGVGMGDPWGNRYSYWVSSKSADSAGFILSTDLATTAATINTRINDTLEEISDNAVTIIMSQGKNSFGTVSVQNEIQPAPPVANVDERDNLDNTLVYVARPATDPGASTVGGEFDDMLIWISEYELKAKMVEAGVLP
jgi:prepilin-type N-terminal cleavage/methylation domain-containing protein